MSKETERVKTGAACGAELQAGRDSSPVPFRSAEPRYVRQVKFVPPKAPSPINVTLAGIVNSPVSVGIRSKACALIVSRTLFDSKTKAFIAVSMKAYTPIDFTLFGIVIVPTRLGIMWNAVFEIVSSTLSVSKMSSEMEVNSNACMPIVFTLFGIVSVPVRDSIDLNESKPIVSRALFGSKASEVILVPRKA